MLYYCRIIWEKIGVGILEEFETTIYEMRQALYEIIDKKEDLLDIEVIAVSQKLDDILNEYNQLIEKKIKN